MLARNAFFCDVIECLRDRKRIGLGKFFENRRLYFLSQSVDRFCARTFAFSAQRLFDSIAGNLAGDIQHLLIHVEQLQRRALVCPLSRPALSGPESSRAHARARTRAL